MNVEQILERFTVLSSLSTEEAEKWRWLCYDAAEYYKTKQNPESKNKCCCGKVTAAAAALAFYQYALLNETQGISQFKAGDVTLGFSGTNTKTAYELWKQAERTAAEELTDGSFFFKQVKS